MRKKWYLVLIFVLVVAQAVISGCSLFQTPQQKPQQTPGMKAPGIEPDVTVYMHKTGEKKKMKMEEYIAGVVAGEMKPEWPVEALAAQAIIARTFMMEAIENKGGVPNRGTQASTDIKEFQAYDASAINDNVRKAVEMTRGMVATYQGRPIKTWFHASAGGITTTAKEGLNYQDIEPPYIRSVESPDDLAPADVQNWTASFTKADIIAALEKLGQKVSTIDSVEIGQKGQSGRAVILVFNKTVQVPGPDFRVALDSIKLKSMLLSKIDVSSDSVVFSGKGYGHGVGMSQWGANKLAQQGKSPEEIVAYYFNGVTIEKRWQ
ncbi:MAG: SpoIID/LytB domain protein [Firmicutes bacterium]|nr:SpoIID/LytB domain protein [Bacillota bacterium]